MSEQDNAEHYQEAIAAINNRDIDAYVELLDESIVLETELAPAPIQGRDAARQLIQSYFDGIPDLHLEIQQIITSGDYVVARTHLTGTHKGTLVGIPATDSSIDVHSCNVVEIRDGKTIKST